MRALIGLVVLVGAGVLAWHGIFDKRDVVVVLAFLSPSIIGTSSQALPPDGRTLAPLPLGRVLPPMMAIEDADQRQLVAVERARADERRMWEAETARATAAQAADTPRPRQQQQPAPPSIPPVTKTPA